MSKYGTTEVTAVLVVFRELPTPWTPRYWYRQKWYRDAAVIPLNTLYVVQRRS